MATTPRTFYRLNSIQHRAILNAQTPKQHRRVWKKIVEDLGIDPKSIEHNPDGYTFYARLLPKRAKEEPREDADAYDPKPPEDKDQ